jgi:hypothetical protein
MGQVITLMPLMNQTIIVEDDTFSNLTAQPVTGATKKSSGSSLVNVGGVGGGQSVSGSGSGGSGSGSGGSGSGSSLVNVGSISGAQQFQPINRQQIEQMPTVPDYGLVPEDSGMGISGGFGASGFGASGDFEQPQINEEYQVLGYDEATKCPIYGYDESGRPLYGVDMNGNIIYDPSQLPCALKSMPSEESPVSQIATDKTLKTALLVLGGLALFTLIMKK